MTQSYKYNDDFMEPQDGFYLEVDVSIKRSDWNWAKTIEIVGSIVDMAGGFVRRWNFNRYKEKDGPLKLSLRMNIQTIHRPEIEEILKEVKSKGIIVDFKPRDQPWTAPHFVIIAHEFATESASKFKRQADRISDVRKIMGLQVESHRIISFFYSLMRLLVGHLNFNIPRLWEYERHSPIEMQKVENIADSCKPQRAKEVLGTLDTHERGNFLERYIHCFFNCIDMQIVMIAGQPLNFEGIVMRRLLDSILWEEISSYYYLPTRQHSRDTPAFS